MSETSILLRNIIQLALKNNILLYFVLKFSFSFFFRPSCQKMRLHQICAKNLSFFSTMRIARFCLGIWLLQNFEHLLPKTVFCFKSSQRIEPPLKNCVSLYYVLKAGFNQILHIFFQKKRFCKIHAKNTNYLFKKLGHLLSKHVFFSSNLRKKYLAPENSFVEN